MVFGGDVSSIVRFIRKSNNGKAIEFVFYQSSDIRLLTLLKYFKRILDQLGVCSWRCNLISSNERLILFLSRLFTCIQNAQILKRMSFFISLLCSLMFSCARQSYLPYNLLVSIGSSNSSDLCDKSDFLNCFRTRIKLENDKNIFTWRV